MAILIERARGAANSNNTQAGPVQDPKLAHVKEVLHTLRARLETQIQSSDEYDDPETHAVLRTACRRLNQVDKALMRIEEGKYGICIDCSKPIEGDRMALQPFSTRCTSCQTVADWRGLDY